MRQECLGEMSEDHVKRLLEEVFSWLMEMWTDLDIEV